MANSDTAVRYRPSPFGLLVALPMAWSLLTGSAVRAGYCSVASMDPIQNADRATPLVFGAASGEASSSADGLAAVEHAAPPPSSAPQQPVDLPLLSLLQHLSFSHQADGGGTSSPPPRSTTGSAGQPLAMFNKPDLPRDERGSRLALETNFWDLPSFPSRLFRPPRHCA